MGNGLNRGLNLPTCEKAIIRCCNGRYVQDLATECFNRNNCPSLQWLGKNACLPKVVNAVMEKNSEKSRAITNSKKFKLKELSEEANIEVVRNGKDEIIGINIMLMEDVKISIGQFLKNIKRFEN